MSVLITDFITNPIIEKKILGKHLVKKYSSKTSILLVWHQKCNKKYLDKFPNLKAIIRYGVGIDDIDIELAKKRSIKVANTPDYGVDEVSDTALSFLLSITRKTQEYNSSLRSIHKFNNKWQETALIDTKRSSSYKVCVIGAGRIGSLFLLKARAIGFKTYFYDPYLPSGYHKVLNAKRINNIKDIGKFCNIISLHCPLNEETNNIINNDFLKILKRGSVIINTARGGLVDEESISKFIKLKNITYATDVLHTEPPEENNKLIKLWRNNKYTNQIIINPHMAFYSKQSFIEMRESAAKNALQFIQKGNLLNRIV